MTTREKVESGIPNDTEFGGHDRYEERVITTNVQDEMVGSVPAEPLLEEPEIVAEECSRGGYDLETEGDLAVTGDVTELSTSSTNLETESPMVGYSRRRARPASTVERVLIFSGLAFVAYRLISVFRPRR